MLSIQPARTCLTKHQLENNNWSRARKVISSASCQTNHNFPERTEGNGVSMFVNHLRMSLDSYRRSVNLDLEAHHLLLKAWTQAAREIFNVFLVQLHLEPWYAMVYGTRSFEF